jgi:hypothetical protein
MSVQNYLLKSSVSAEEIRMDFRPEEVSQLYKALRALGPAAYLAFVKDNLADILRYISLSLSQRRQKKWSAHPNALLLRFAALQVSESVLQLQAYLSDVTTLVDGGSYRKFHAEFAKNVMYWLFSQPLRSFPFENYGNPFF